MATKTLIRNERPHEVKLGQGDQLAQSPKVDAQELQIPPPLARKSTARTDAQKAASEAAASAPRKARADTGAAPRRKRATAAPAEAPAAAKPKLPARVPADRLWEDDSVVAQRLNALLQHNARLAEQLQRLQSPARSKGIAP